MNVGYLVETCLLSHGLKSVPDDAVYDAFGETDANFAWIESGEIRIGRVDEFIQFRSRKIKIRGNRDNFQKYIINKEDAALTASGVMEICRREGIKLAVTCGMGGVDLMDSSKVSSDLPALAELPVSLLATSPKDVLDIPATLKWLRSNSVKVLGLNTDICTGYVFADANVRLDGAFSPESVELKGQQLLLNEVDKEDRISDNSILTEAIRSGREAFERGEYFHPAANARLDELTNGKTSFMQLNALRRNVQLADIMTGNK